jgi:ApaG protein
MTASEATTEGVRISVRSRYVPEKSTPEQGEYLFIYTVRVANDGAASVQLWSRHWVITDGNGRVQEVRGTGVVGVQPELNPGQAFEYTSFCPLPTPVGSMQGSYRMRRADGTSFDAAIGTFTLSEPYAFN